MIQQWVAIGGDVLNMATVKRVEFAGTDTAVVYFTDPHSSMFVLCDRCKVDALRWYMRERSIDIVKCHKAQAAATV